MKAFDMHDEEEAGSSDVDYMNSFSTWVPVLHVHSFTKYMSSFHEVCCNDTMPANRLGHTIPTQEELSREEFDARIQEYFRDYAPPSVTGPKLEEVMLILRNVN